MTDRTIVEARDRLIRVLSNSANSADATALIKAIEDLVDAKVRVAINRHVDFEHCETEQQEGGRF